jgi:chromosome partitioning protein
MRDIVRKTYFHGLDVVPASLELSEFETESPKALMENNQNPFFMKIAQAIDQVADDYDVVIMDCPPQLGFISMAALYAATGLVVPVHPHMVDVMSMSQFMTLAGSLMGIIEGKSGQPLKYDFEKILITRHKPTDQAQISVVTFLRSLFKADVLSAPMLESTAVADCGLLGQTLYEAVKDSANRRTYDRALQAMNAVNDEIEAEILRTWGRTTVRNSSSED